MKPIQPHPDHHELHGITVAVDTHGAEIYVGRCHDIDPERIYLVDVAVHTAGGEAGGKRDFLERAAKFGHWKQHDRLAIDRSQVAWMETLGRIAENGPPTGCV